MFIDNRSTYVPAKPPQPPVIPNPCILERTFIDWVTVKSLLGMVAEDLRSAWERKCNYHSHTIPPDRDFGLVEVNPQVIVKINSRGPIVIGKKKDAYIQLWKAGQVAPPIIIDSSGSLDLLLEGRHRVASAAAIGLLRIRAIDIALWRMVPLDSV